jgi:hypothetical protein
MWRREVIVLIDISEELRLQPPAHAGSSLADFLYPEDGGGKFRRNVG